MSSLKPTLPKTQRQWQQRQRGLPKDALQLVHDAPVPIPQPGEVLVRISHVAPTPIVWKMMGLMPGFMRRNAVPEIEATGTVVDANGSAFEVGTKVMGMIDENDHFRRGRGVLSEYALFKKGNLSPIPPNLNLTTAAGIMTGGITAYRSLVEAGHIKAGSRVFINGGTTASGIAAIQVAKIYDAGEIVVSCSAASSELVKELGAHEAIDYKASPLTTQLTNDYSSEPFDIVMDCIGSHSLFVASPAFLKPTGIYAAIAIDVPRDSSWLHAAWLFTNLLGDIIWPKWLGGTPRQFVFASTPIEETRMVYAAKWAGEGKLKVLIDSVHNSEQKGVMTAYERAMSGRAKGKILINMEKD
ncbi:MAG: hypothetical protein M1827_004049 [Pycnora praestabilis]|nr:MAG: hypothetical protein M1827_004049 [Pycnora praestabilis]